MVTRVDAAPAFERNEGKEAGDIAGRAVERVGAKERVVAALVQQHEPFDQRGGEHDLANCPRRHGVMGGQPAAGRGDRDGTAEDDRAAQISGFEMVQVSRTRWRRFRSHVFVSLETIEQTAGRSPERGLNFQ